MNFNNRAEEDTRYNKYTFESYKRDIRDAMSYEPPQRGAFFAAASKNLKKACLINFVIDISKKENLDMTPTLASNLIKGWTKRSVTRTELMNHFAITDRTAADKSKNLDNQHQLIARYFDTINKKLKSLERKMGKYRRSIKS